MVILQKRDCEGCGTLFDVNPRERNRRRWCSDACRIATRYRRTREAAQPAERKCPECGSVFFATGKRILCGSENCGKARGNARRQETRSYLKHTRIRRAQTRGPGAEEIDRFEIADRDEWTCQLCDEQIPLVALWPHPLAFTIDHAVPLKAGGPHTRDNVQASHLACNLAKGARVPAAKAS